MSAKRPPSKYARHPMNDEDPAGKQGLVNTTSTAAAGPRDDVNGS